MKRAIGTAVSDALSHNARRLPTLDAEGGQCPRARAARHHQQRGPEGEQPHQRLPGVCATGRSEAEDAVESTNFRVAEVPEAKPEGLLCDRRRRENRPGPGGPTCGDEQGTTCVLSPKRDLWAARAQGPARRAER